MSFLDVFEDLKTQTNNQLGLYLFCCSVTVIWIVFVLFFNSRIIGSLVTFFINLYLKRYSKTVWIRIRALSVSFLSGKIMLRGIHYVTTDYTLYIQDGWITFAYWKPQFAKEKSKSKSEKSNTRLDSPKRSARLNIFLCNFQLHYYNSFKTSQVNESKETSELSTGQNGKSIQNFIRTFSSSSVFNFLTGGSENQNQTTYSNPNNNSKVNLVPASQTDYNFTEDLMQLFSVVNIRIQKGRIFAGNHTLPSTLNIRFSNAKMELVTEKSQSKVDEYCFILKGDLNKLEVSLLANKKLQFNEPFLPVSEKKLENRIIIFKSTSSDFIYVQDVPSILTFDRRYLKKNEIGELIQNEKEPEWSLKLNCNKQTILNYGPWYDRQREALWKFFFPSTYETLEPQPEPTLNERRQTSKFDFEIVLKDPNTEVNLIFTSTPQVGNTNLENLTSSNVKDYSEYQKKFSLVERKLTLRCRVESFLRISIPWLTKQYGYKSKIYGEFNSVQSNTNLSFGEFLCTQKLKLDVDINYPLVWNDLQIWNINVDLFNGSTYFVFYHKNFFQELIYDWSTRVMSDVRHFVPFIYKIKVKLNNLEAILPCNQHNWIDTQILENNSFFAVLAKEAYISLDINFEDFHPEKTNVVLDVKIFDACARFIIPPTNAYLALLKILKKNLKYIPFNGAEKCTFESNHWSQFSSSESDLVAPAINSGKGSSKPKKSSSHSKSKGSKNENTDAKNHVRFNKNINCSFNHFVENWIECWQAKNASVVLNFEYHPSPLLDWNNKNLPSVSYLKSFNSPHFDCEVFNPDTIFLEIEIGPSLVMLYGTFLKRLWYIKEAYFSWDQFYTEIAKNLDLLCSAANQDSSMVSKPYYDIPVSLLTCNHKDPRNFRPLSVQLSLAIHNINGYLVLDPTDGAGNTPVPIGFTKLLALELDKKYSETKLQLFVDPVNIFIEDLVDRKFDQNLHQGHLCLSSVQVRGHAMFSDEERLKTDTLEYAWLLEILLGDVTGAVTPVQVETLVHGVESLILLLFEDEYQLKPVYWNRTDPGLPYKYEVTRFSLDLIDIYLVESGTALNFNLHPVRMSVCNSHTRDYAKGLSACVGQFFLKLFINEASRIEPENVIPYQSSTFKRAFDHSHIKNPKADSVSNISSSSSLSSISISTLNSSTIFSKMDRTASQQTVTMEEQNKNSDVTLESTFNQSNAKQPDSNQFNYWFECSSLSSGKITIDLTLDKGTPEEQVKFLHLHDLKTKRLFFLWDHYKFNSDHICGCVGGCNYYSVFDYTGCLDQLKPDNFEFFDLDKSISRCNPHFGQSLFHPNLHIAQSQPIMFKSYPDESYDYNDILIQNQDIEKKMMHETGLSVPRPENVSINKSNASLSKSKLRQSKIRLSSSMSTLANRQSKNSEFDDYYTADEEDEDENSVKKKPKSKRPRTSLKSLQSSRSSRSKQSYFSLGPLNTSDNSEHLSTDATLRPHDNTDVKYSNVFDSEPKMDLNFDIKRPILDSSLPKYCYLKYLSRAYVHNWNQTSSYPFYDDFSEKNIFFCYRKKGIDFTNLVSTEYQTRSLGKINSSSHELNEDESVIKRRINLKFKTFECYITPLSLTALTRFTDSLKLYQMNANSMISALQSKTITNSIAESFIEAISKTQVSLKIPEIRLFALQCGLAEGDKISNAFVSTLANPDEFITLSLLSICIYSIQTQLIDCQNRTNAIFMIDKIDSQFCRLYDPDNLKKILNQNDGRSEMDKTVKLSCISNENSKTSIDYNVGDSNLQCIIMQECALDRISIKAIKKINEDVNDKLLNNTISICEFDIQNIWFSFPEPPTSPKGKRKIPFSRFDWNLLSSVSPAVISWMCASKDCISSVKQLFTTRTNSLNKTIACLLSGAHSNKDLLNSVISCQFYNFKKPASQHPLSSRSKSSKANNNKDSTAFEPSKFLQAYLDEPSYLIKNDPSCKLVNMMRNYFLFFSDQFKVELSLSDGNVKKLVNETLMAWAGDLAEDQSVAKTDHYQSMVVNLAQRNEFKTELVESSRMRKITISDDSMENEKSSDESSMTRPINRADIQNINKMFKPVLGYIGIDAPSGTLMDNLFKEFGSLLFGNLNIKSVQINILGSNGIKNALFKFDPELDNFFKVKTLAPKSLDADQKIITTILSFDDLIFSINVRQVIPEVASKAEDAMASEKKSMSMNNPLYANSVKIIDAKYYTKIDAGIQVNNLVQEVNMPLLRLAHQIYSIIADAVDLEKEKNKLNGSISFSKDEHKSSHEKLLERKNSLRIQERNVHVKKDYFAIKDKSHVSFFGWFNIRKVNFKAAVGNLALNGQMKNFQSTVLMGRKIIGSSSKLQYDGSLNIRMDSAFGKLFESDKKINVVLLNIQKSHLFGYLSNKSVFSSFVHIGMINIDVPIQPVIVHGVVIRESKVIEQNILPEIKNFAIFENDEEHSKEEKQTSGQEKSKTRQNDLKTSSSFTQDKMNKAEVQADKASVPSPSLQTITLENETLSSKSKRTLSRKSKHQMSLSADNKKGLLHKFKLNFKSKFDGLEVRAKLLETPCLKAAYLIQDVECTLTLTNDQSHFTCLLNKHSLSFQCDDQINDQDLKSTFMTMKPLEQRTNFFLPSIYLNGKHLSKCLSDNQSEANRVQKFFNLSEVRFVVEISPLNRELDAEVIAQLVFVAKVFLKEINNILQAVYGFEEVNEPAVANTPRSAKSNTAESFSSHSQPQSSVVNYFFYDFKIEMGKISVTGITPSDTALSIYTSDKSSLSFSNLKNAEGIDGLKLADLVKNFDFSLKPYVETKSQLSIELRKNCSDDGLTNDWYQLAYFDTKFDLRNERKRTSSNLDREAIKITVEKPRFYLQPGAVDCAILFWLNYKDTYEFWLQQRQELSNQTDFLRSTSSPITFPQNMPDKSSIENFLTLKLRVTGLGLALPLSGKMYKSFFASNMDCLVISLHETAIFACSSGCIVSKGQFSNFSLRFIENFNLSSSDWVPILSPTDNRAHSSFFHKNLINSWIVPSGYYEVCSSTIDKPKPRAIHRRNDPKNLLKNAPLWILSVKWKMEGIDINFDTNIGKWLSKLGDTVTSLADTQSILEQVSSQDDQDPEIRRLKQELIECMERGETSKANVVQSKIDLMSFASYPEKAKQIFVKTKNKLGLNQTLTPTSVIRNPFEKKSLENEAIPEKSSVIRRLNASHRRHSVSNDDINLTNVRPNNLNSSILYEENENENMSSTSNPNITPENRAAQLLASQAPSIDFKLSVKIDISSGKCVLHADKPSNQPNVRSPYMNSPVSGGYFSPELMKGFAGNTNFTPNISSTYHDPESRKTTFIFPAIGVQTFYESTNKKKMEKLTKKASLYAMIKIESFAMPTSIQGFNSRDLYMSRDMVLSPALLDFIEQTLEPFDLKSSINTPEGTKSKIQKSESLDENSINNKINENKEPNFFPVDVVVFVSMKPSAIRFTCVPQSTMECLLKLPSVEMVVSTSRVDSQTQTKLENILKSEEPNDFFLSNSLSATYNDGGLNLTCSLSDFSLKFYNRLAIRNTIDPRFYYNDAHSTVFEEKDSLSVRVAYIKVNISRNKRAVSKFVPNQAYMSNSNSGQNEVKLSILADVGSTSFIYDMRNIKEVFVFPKIWYRRSFARRIIFGDEISTSTVPMGHDTFRTPQTNVDTSVQTNNNSKIIKRPKSLDLDTSSSSILGLNPNWKTLVLISVNIAGLEVRMNIGSVLGNVCLLAKNGRLSSKISLSRFGPRDMEYNLSIDNTNLIAEGGSNGILLRIQDINTAIKINENDKKTNLPLHKIEFGIYAAECRVDSAYNQASPIFVLRFSNLNVKLSDSWFNLELADRLPEALVDLNMTWDQLHLMMTRSTTADLIILYYKLIEYFNKQFIESKDYIKECELDLFYEMKVKQQFIEKKESSIVKKFNVNGGNINLKGNNFTLITFHGNSFKAIKWAVFSVNEPSMDFASQSHLEDGKLKNQQSLIFSMGRSQRKKDMASIYMVYRDSASIFTKLQTINEWFDYAHSTIDAVGLRDFPRFSTDEHPMLLTQTLKKKSSDQTKWEDIFHLPSMQVFCDTTLEDANVKFEFKTEFHDHIQLTLRTELFGFLHELITSYVKETDILRSKEPNIPSSKKDERIYECIKWELEPTLRLISKFGSSVEPLGVDGLLKSLGFHHARSTIPKWLQRGLLDNLEEVMHGLIKVYLKILSDFNPSRSQIGEPVQ